MVVRKILEATLVAGSTSVTFTDTDIPNSLLRVYCTRSALFPLSQTLSGNSVTVTYKPQDSNIGVALEIVKSGLDIVDDLLTADSTKALSANQGYVLKGLIDGIVIPTVPENITDLDDVEVTSIEDGQVLAWDSDSSKFVNVNQSGGGDSYPFINLSNEIYNSGIITSNFSSFSYTATQDCWVRIGTHGTGVATSIIYVNSVLLCGAVSSTDITFTPFFIKSGDVITLRDLAGCTYSIVAYGTR